MSTGAKWFAQKVTLRRWQKLPNGLNGWDEVPAKVDVLIDFDGLYQLLGNKALSNKSKRTRVLRGLITAEATRLKKEGEDVG